MAGSNFVDYVKIFARSGHGGAGSAHFRREKFVAFGGPDGGDGGRGGSIVLQGDSQYWTLIHLKYQRHQFAEDGEGGSGARSSGKDARDIVIPVPLGTVAKRVVENEQGETELVPVGEVTADGERLVLLKGGRGGLGNWHFKSATNQAPSRAQAPIWQGFNAPVAANPSARACAIFPNPINPTFIIRFIFQI